MKTRETARPSQQILTGQTERIASVSPAASVRVLSKTVVVATIALIVAGSLVTSNKASLADPTWPLFLDGWFPKHFDGGLKYVYIHRLSVVVVTLLTLVQALMIQVKDPRRFMKKLAWGSCALIILQALFGAVVLKSTASPLVSMFHAFTAQAFLCSTIAIAIFSSRMWFADLAAPLVQRVENRGYIAFTRFFLLLLFIQVLLGGGVRHSNEVNDLFFPFIIAHIGSAFVVIFAVIWYALRTFQVYRDVKPLIISAKWAAGLVCYQLVFGMLAILSNRARLQPEMAQLHHVLFSTAHVMGGTSLLALMFGTLLRAHRLLDLNDYSHAPAQAYHSQEVKP